MTEQAMIVTEDQLDWFEYPPGSGAMMAMIEGDLREPGPFTCRVKFPAGAKMSVHWHPAPFIEKETVLSGTFYLGFGDQYDESSGVALKPGAVIIIPPNLPHYAWTPEETILQVHGTGPWIVRRDSPEAASGAQGPATAKA